MQTLLVATYEMGRQPFGLASPAAWLKARGHQVSCADLSVESLSPDAVRRARLIAFYLPMHTATRLASKAIEKVKALNLSAHLCCYGLYAPLNESYLRKLGVNAILGGEFESALADLADRLAAGALDSWNPPPVSLEKLRFLPPDRSSLPQLGAYAKLRIGAESKLVGYTEASRGCKHLCRHCPVVPVYRGAFRVVQPEVVIEDIRRQVQAGAQHITFGDPDFLNGPTHAIRIVEALSSEFPGLTYDATIKIEHLLRHRDLLPVLRRTGCILVTSAVESVDDAVLEKLDKGHTRRDFIEVVRELRALDLPLSPTFIPFTPWTTRAGYRDLLDLLIELELVDHVSPIQLALRLLIPSSSLLLELPDVAERLTGFDEAALLHRWKHADPAMDSMAARALRIAARNAPRRELFEQFWSLVHDAPFVENYDLIPRAAIPYMDEPWYC
jgi:radical SAM superfamily enzyme YgiQ (UPF0313 family)